ncbi:efflux transporter periplasmic adaptor subunit [Pleomorphomonas diazotrophica]|uniref:Efflux transporter periplasmic adaptor subunit n=1 Tax=Pleomorphomonas diazotrophica TaxID=1166257 RepID=A0A1I4S816_9HYPH|nr:efflux RND transporter periplasmic adaptor subunit [Pleomorphomonas diazotrophica]PKR89892.1 efflux transporter periplasmic adaptor subunit [Pleomorphomonas diazotrophica]SFM60403.1 membrane fusion protein, multidrug efflux system [Pleomorphomonas diazotrophica]
MRAIGRLGGVVLVLTLIAACQPSGPSGPPPAGKAEVGYVSLQPTSVPHTMELPGRVIALATAEIRPQVSGIVRKIAFKEGGVIEAGDVLYELDDAKFKAAYAAASAAVKKAEAATAGAQTAYDRNAKLAESNAVAAQTVDDSRSTLLQAQASEEAARADLETARINLENATIRAPIGGVIGVSAVSVGALVTENQTDALATIRQIDPINVDLVDSSANLLRIRDEVNSGRLGRGSGNPPAVTLTLENGKPYGTAGSVSLTEMVVSETTGTFTLRATFPNSQRVLLPGMFVQASVDLGSLNDAFLVPQRAVTRSDDGVATVYVVSQDNKAETRRITTAGTSGNNWIVTDGLSAGDRLIVDGFQKFSAGAEVVPVEATIDDDGVVEQDLTAGSGK